MVYDAGNFKDTGRSAMSAIEKLIPENEEIDLLVLSHCDADHLAAVPEICDRHRVITDLRDGLKATTQTWKAMNRAIADEVEHEGCVDINLQNEEVEPLKRFDFGDVAVTAFNSKDDNP